MMMWRRRRRRWWWWWSLQFWQWWQVFQIWWYATGTIFIAFIATQTYIFFHSDIDECASMVPYCSPDATCNNTKGSYQCRCNEGFSGDGKECKGKNLRCCNCVKFVKNGFVYSSRSTDSQSCVYFQILMSVLRKPTTAVLKLFAIIPRAHTTAHANLDTMETELIAA